MALAINPIGKVSTPEVESPKIYSDSYKHSTIESTYQNTSSLLTQIKGVPTLVEYYRFYGNTESPAPFSPSNAATYQSYTRIKELIIKQDGDGSFDYDPTTGESTSVCTGYVMFDVTPVKYDLLITDIGDGKAGLFQVTEQPEPLTLFADKAYRITYQLVSILTEFLYNELDRRVVNELVYSKDSALLGGVSLITEPEFNLAKKLYNFRTTIAENILRKFYWNAERTIAYDAKIIKHKDKDTNDGSSSAAKDLGMCYDQYLVKFIKNVITRDLVLGYPHINTFSTQYGGKEFGIASTLNIFDVLLRLDFNLLSQCDNEAHLIAVTDVVNTRLYGNISSSKFKHLLVTDKENYGVPEKYLTYEGFPLIPIVPAGEVTYLFSNSFYEGVSTNVFEKLVLDIARDKVVNRNALWEYCSNYFKLTELEQLYHGSILIYLINLSRKFSSAI